MSEQRVRNIIKQVISLQEDLDEARTLCDKQSLAMSVNDRLRQQIKIMQGEIDALSVPCKHNFALVGDDDGAPEYFAADLKTIFANENESWPTRLAAMGELYRRAQLESEDARKQLLNKAIGNEKGKSK